VELVSSVLKLAVMVRGGTITTHWSSWPIRAQCAFQKEGIYRDRNLTERYWQTGKRGAATMENMGKIMNIHTWKLTLVKTQHQEC